MKKINVLFALVMILLMTSCVKKSNKELIIGNWEIKEGKINHITNLYFGEDKRFRMYMGSIEIETEDVFEYWVIDEKDLIDYPNFNIEKNTGNVVSVVLVEKNGSYYNGSNMFGPFKIISISKDELCLECINGKNDLHSLFEFRVTLKRVYDSS